MDLDDDDSIDNDDGWLILDYTYSNVHNSSKRVREWIGAEKAAGITPEPSTATPGPSVIQWLLNGPDGRRQAEEGEWP